MQFSAEKVMQIWSGWEIRVLVLLSLSFQIILILFGSQRKYIAKSWIKILVWLAYLAADWAATVALGNLATNQGNSGDQPSYNLLAFWSPFLLLHLGGPDTITAYSLEDNELWLRHLLGLVVQVEVAFYIFIKSWSNNALTFIAISVFIAGVIKYGERTFVLWSSSIQRFRDSLLSTVDPSPSLIRVLMKGDTENPLQNIGLHELHEAHFLFKRFSHLYAGLVLSDLEVSKSTKIFDQKSAKEAFNLVSIELGFMYDVLYTKATVVFSRLGIFLRFVTFCSSVSTLVVFSVIVDIHHYSLIAVSITYVLLVVAIVLEVYTLILHFCSDWTNLVLLVKFRNEEPSCYGAKCLHYQSLLTNHKRWAASMGQFNLLSYCLKDTPTNFFNFFGIQKLLSVNKFLERSQYSTSEDVNLDLLEVLYKEIENTRLEPRDYFNLSLDQSGKSILARRGDHVLEEKYSIDLSQQIWYTSKREFNESLLIWHVATDLCYHQDFAKHGEEIDNSHPRCKISRCLSNYMLYLQVFCPSMMPKGIGELRFRETCHEALRLLKLERNVITNTKGEACKLLFERKPLFKSNEDEKMSVLESVVMLVSNLQSLGSTDDWGLTKKWEMISEVWVEMVMYAASHCDWKEHGQQLGRGGELLTHVCLLMAHTGTSAQYDVLGKNIP